MVFGAGSPAEAESRVDQTFVLKPGWNAIWLEVLPDPNEADLVFRNLPVDSVWTWAPDPSAVDFIQDVSEPVLERLGFRSWFPPDHPEGALTNLYRVQRNRAYLLHVTGSSPIPWTVTGTPGFRTRRWIPGSHNLVGMPLVAGATATFAELFDGSRAHVGLQVRRLAADGTWLSVTNPAAIGPSPGEAFWIWTEGSSDWSGPIAVEADTGNEIDFGAVREEAELAITNRSPVARNVTVELDAAAVGLLVRQTFEPDRDPRFSWEDFPASLPLSLAPGERAELDLGLRRAELSGPLAGLLTVRDAGGFQSRGALRAESGPAARGSGGGITGLWSGTVSLDAVAEVHGDDPMMTPTPTASVLGFRILFHTDATGQVRLLKQVVQMFEEGDSTTTPPTPGRLVLVTDPARLSDFVGSALRDGDGVGRRMSAVTYDYDARSVGYDGVNKAMEVAGSVEEGGTVGPYTLELPPDLPTHPYNHRFHPSFDRCGCATGDDACHADCDEAWTLSRTITVTFAAADPTADPESGKPQPDWGVSRLTGAYQETLVGLHREPLVFSGRIELRWVTDVAELNP